MSASATEGIPAPRPATPRAAHSLWNRQLDRYPATTARYGYLAIVVAATVVLYYMLYIQYAVSTAIITHFNMTFTYFVYVSVVGNAVGAFASLLAGLADRWGRANMTIWGLLISGALVAFAVPNASSRACSWR